MNAATENAWRAIDREFGLLSATDVGLLVGSRSGRPGNLAREREARGELLGSKRGSALVFPRFQFDEYGEVLPVVIELLSLQTVSSWSAASLILWCVAPNGYLSGRRPVDLLRTEPEAVVRAARFAMDPDPAL